MNFILNTSVAVNYKSRWTGEEPTAIRFKNYVDEQDESINLTFVTGHNGPKRIFINKRNKEEGYLDCESHYLAARLVS